MADTPKKPALSTVKAMVDGMISDAIHFDGSELAERRKLALAYQDGEMPDLEADEGKSKVVEQILADAMGWLLPNLTRIFLSSDRIAIYEPVPPKRSPGMPDQAYEAEVKRVEQFAEQATDYINSVFLKQCGGEKLLRDAIYNGLLHGNGIVKHWWDKTPRYEVEEYSGLSDQQFEDLVFDDDVEVLEHTAFSDPSMASLPLLAGPAGDLASGLGVPSAQPGMAGSALGNGPLDPAGTSIVPGAQAGTVAAGQAPTPGPMAGGGMAAAAGGQPQLVGMGGPGVPGAPPQAPLGPVEGSLGDPTAALLDAILPGIGHNMPPVPMLHDVKIRRTVSTGRLRVVAVANEDFLIESSARALNEDECRFCAHRDTPTRSELVEQGYDVDVVWDLGTVTETETDNARNGRNMSAREEYEDKAGERVEVFECYARLDLEGTGTTQLYQVVVAGHSGAREVLRVSEWGGRLPFSDIVPDPVPHRWIGRSLYDRLRDPQRVATALKRRLNDSLYMAVEPQRAVDMRMVENPDALFNIEIGGIIRTKGDPRQAIMDLAVPFVGQQAQPIIEEERRTAERRVGVGEQSAGLDADTLQHQVATAVAATQSASGLRKEDYARCIQIGVHRMFSCILRLVVENQDRPEQVRVRNDWVDVDPRGWSAEMDVDVNTGLGAGDRTRDLAMLQGVLNEQKAIIAQVVPMLGLDNPICGIKEFIGTLQMMVEAAGIKSPDRFFKVPDAQALQQITQMMQQAKQQQPDPKAAAAQAQLQITAQKAQADAALAQQRAQADVQLNAAKMLQQQALQEAKLAADIRVREADAQHRMDLDRAKAQQDMVAMQLKAQAEQALAQAKADAALEIERVKAAAQLQLRERELQLEMQLKSIQAASNLNPQNATNLEMPS